MIEFIKRIDTVFLEVSNLQLSIKWYTDTLGLSIHWEEGVYAALRVGETRLTLVEAKEVPVLKHVPFNFFTNDIDAAFERLKNENVQVGQVKEYGQVKAFHFKDPDGHSLAICSYIE